MFHETLLLYIAAIPRTASAVLVVERDAQVIAKEDVGPPPRGLLLRRRLRSPLPLARICLLHLR
jgi:hypothetical protein